MLLPGDVGRLLKHVAEHLICTHMYVFMYVCMYVYMYVYVCMYTYVYVCMYVFMCK